MTKEKIKVSPSLFAYVKRQINLADFLSTEIGCTLYWYDQNVSAGTLCPMPDHKDRKPSFRIKYLEDDKVWIYNCLGCGSKGTIIDFCHDFYGLNNVVESVLFICDKFGLGKTDDFIMEGIKDAEVTVNLQKKINCSNIVASRQCFSLLKKDYSRYNIWVRDAYRKLNKALDAENIDLIESIGYEASIKLKEK